MLSRRGPSDWRRGLKSLRHEVNRVTDLLRSVQHPAAPALGHWSVAEVAMHLSQAWLAVPSLANRDLSAIYEVLPGVARRAGPSLIADMWDLAALTSEGVANDPERNCSELADRIEQRAKAYFAQVDASAATESRAWLVDGAQVVVPTLTYHLLNETVVHAWDMARGDGQRWEIAPSSAAQILEGFIVPVIRALGPRDMVDQLQAAGLRATYELRIRGCRPYAFAFYDGALTVEDTAQRPIDCVIDADPVAMLLVTWGRESQAKFIVDRRLLASGSKDWLGPRFRALMRNP